MPRNRFELILKFLHFNDNNTKAPDNTDKLYKIRPVYDLMVAKWRDLYDPGEFISIDEGTLKWRGRLSFRVYNKDKPTKYGIKGYILCDSDTAYCWNLDLYHGQGNTLRETVIGLMDRLLNNPYSLYMDNLYNSVELSEELLNTYQVHTCGTLRKNRGEPVEIRQVGDRGHIIPRFDTVSRSNGTVMVLAWQDKRTVRMVSTKHDKSTVEVERFKKGGHGEKEKIQKPVCITEYNAHMSGVDNLDQMLSYYPFTRKTIKWHKKVVFYLIEVALHNAFIVHKLRHDQPEKTLLDFHLAIVKKLCNVVDKNDDSDDDSGDEDPTQPPARVPKHDPRESVDRSLQVPTGPKNGTMLGTGTSQDEVSL
ncbi:piggyBac transposable element-derived protein 4-like [Lineus longissimus]|uniref:piggyBac transposable element-derived protein 4-like n=1 Tax=Lineus longissimus TaxID=88925 RepID=UPI00315D63A1